MRPLAVSGTASHHGTPLCRLDVQELGESHMLKCRLIDDSDVITGREFKEEASGASHCHTQDEMKLQKSDPSYR